MRKLSLLLTGLLLMLPASAAWAQDKPTPPDSGTSTSAPGSEPGVEPAFTVEVEEVTTYVDGRLVKGAPPGVEVTVRVRLHNFSDSTLRDVRAHVDPSQEARIVDADATYGTIAAGASDNGEFRIVINREGCPPDFLGLGGEVTYDGGKSFLKFAVPTACPGPRLNLSEARFDGGDGDGVPEPGETLRVSVFLQNIGHDPATGVRARLRVSGEGVATETENLAWPDIAPEANVKSITPLTLTISKDAQRQEGCQPLPGDGGVIQIPPEEGGPDKDTPVSSDGSTPADGNVSSQPGSAGGGAPPSTGTDQPTVVEPDPGTAEPGSASPEPAPDPAKPEPAPAPEQDPAAIVQIHLDVTASDYTASLDYSNQIVCAVAEGGAPAADLVAKRSDGFSNTTPTGSSTLPLTITILMTVAAIGARKLIVS